MRRLLPIALSAGLLFSVAAYGQGSVTLYGIVDSGIAWVHNAADDNGQNQRSLFAYSGGNMQGSRWGLRGNEDLGGGLAAIFQIESGFNLGTGRLKQGGRAFGRKAVVGLSGANWGTVTLGRQLDPVVDLVQALTDDGPFSGVFGTPGDVDNYDNSVRVSNSIKYVSPTFSGLKVEALYGFGGVAGSIGSGQTWSLGAGWSGGPLSLAAGYFYANGGNPLAATGNRGWSGSSDSLFNTVINEGFASAHSIKIVRAGGQYVVGQATLGVAYSNTRYGTDAYSSFGQTAKYNNGSAFFNWQFTPVLMMGLGYNYTALTGPASAHYNQANLGIDYTLTKRTDVYALAGYQKASGHTLDSAGRLVRARAAIGNYGVSSGASSQALSLVGIRHRF
ncbi:porin [Burkholderia sp. WAC0059]|uniref:porin n=1 Tax=Burkholderia sp. WAC0059 TaxID=2066022 RepID=UPI000C7F3117|nr:porin [Burkholderia sp. WAC0059]PLZ04353.1 porin [Burkholderia sp. WAC0059]